MKPQKWRLSWCTFLFITSSDFRRMLDWSHRTILGWWWWRWRWWIVFVAWLTDGRRFALFPAGTIVKDPHHRESPTCREQDEYSLILNSWFLINVRNSWNLAVIMFSKLPSYLYQRKRNILLSHERFSLLQILAEPYS